MCSSVEKCLSIFWWAFFDSPVFYGVLQAQKHPFGFVSRGIEGVFMTTGFLCEGIAVEALRETVRR